MQKRVLKWFLRDIFDIADTRSMLTWYSSINCNSDYIGKKTQFAQKNYGELKKPLKLGRELRKRPIDPILFVKA
jgi:hypothetical protein